MRFNTWTLAGMLLQSAAFAQDTTTATPTEEATPISGSGASSTQIPVDLTGATVNGGGKIGTYQNTPAAFLDPGVANSATLTPLVTIDNFETDDEVVLTCEVGVGSTFAVTKRQEVTDCKLYITIDGVNVYGQGLQPSTQMVAVLTDLAKVTANPAIIFTYTCTTSSTTIVIKDIVLTVGKAIDITSGGGDGSSSSSSSSTTMASSTSFSTSHTSSTAGTSSATGTPSSTESSSAAEDSSKAETLSTPEASATPDASSTASASSKTETMVTATPSSTPAPGKYPYYGCVRSTGGFPTFHLGGESEEMKTDLCASFCQGFGLFGLYKNRCYCGEKIDPANTAKVADELCNIHCAGDKNEVCGGDLEAAAGKRFARRPLSARQAVSNDILLSVYINEAGVGDGETTVTITETSATVTQTVDVIAGGTKTLTTVVQPTGGSTTYVIFVPYPGDYCRSGEVVYVQEPCTCKGGVSYTPKICTATSCKGEVVYKPEPCPEGEKGNHEVVYQPEACSGKGCGNGTVSYKPCEEEGKPPGSGTPGAGTPGSGTPGSGTPGSGTPGSGTPSTGGSSGTKCSGYECDTTPGAGTPGSGTPGSGSGSGATTPGAGTPGSSCPGPECKTPGSGSPGAGTPGAFTPASSCSGAGCGGSKVVELGHISKTPVTVSAAAGHFVNLACVLGALAVAFL